MHNLFPLATTMTHQVLSFLRWSLPPCQTNPHHSELCLPWQGWQMNYEHCETLECQTVWENHSQLLSTIEGRCKCALDQNDWNQNQFSDEMYTYSIRLDMNITNSLHINQRVLFISVLLPAIRESWGGRRDPLSRDRGRISSTNLVGLCIYSHC